MSQNDILRKLFREGGTTTTFEATTKLGICRLSERVREIEAEDNVEIPRTAEKNGKKRWIRYGGKKQLDLLEGVLENVQRK